MTKLHLCHIIEGCSGGTARQLMQMVTTLPKKGCKLSIVVGSARSADFIKLVQTMNTPSVDIFEVKMNRSVSPISDIVSLIKIYKIIRNISPDIIHTHCSKAGVLGRVIAKLNKCPVIHTPHIFPTEWASNGIVYYLYYFVERMMARITTKMIVLNDEQQRFCLEDLHLEQDRVCLLENGVDCEEFSPASKQQIKEAKADFGIDEHILTIGIAARIEPQKGLFDLVKAMRLVKNNFPRVKLLVAGEGNLHKKLISWIKKYNLENNISLIGIQSAMPKFYHSLDLFVLSSHWEGMPYVVLEAQACGLAVVASSCSGTIALITPGVTGKLVQISNQDSLAGAICSCLRDKRQRDNLGKNSRLLVAEKRTISMWADKLYALYQSV